MVTENPTNRLKKVALVALMCYGVALVISTHIPHPPQLIFPQGITDKVLHLSAYFGLSFLLAFNWALRRTLGWRQWLGIVAILAAFGGIDEVTQIPVGRQCDVFDWLADMTGIVLGLVSFLAASFVVRGPAERLRRV